jgi:hypothetical protein
MKKSFNKNGRRNKPAATISRRDFLKYSGAAGGALLFGLHGDLIMANSKSQVAFLSTEDRKSGVALSIKALGINPVKNKDVLIKPNFNTADPAPGSTHNDTLVALVEEVWKMGAKSVSLGERSYPPTRSVMEHKGILPLMKALDVKVIDFDNLDQNDWVKVKPKASHWQDGFRVARPMPRFHLLSEDPPVRWRIHHVTQTARRGGPYRSAWLQLYERTSPITRPAKADRRNKCGI